MAVTSARKIGDLKEKGLFERDNERIDKYTVGNYSISFFSSNVIYCVNLAKLVSTSQGFFL